MDSSLETPSTWGELAHDFWEFLFSRDPYGEPIKAEFEPALFRSPSSYQALSPDELENRMRRSMGAVADVINKLCASTDVVDNGSKGSSPVYEEQRASPYSVDRTLEMESKVKGVIERLSDNAIDPTCTAHREYNRRLEALKEKVAVAWATRRLGASISYECRDVGPSGTKALQECFFKAITDEANRQDFRDKIAKSYEIINSEIDRRDQRDWRSLAEAAEERKDEYKSYLKEEKERVSDFLKALLVVADFVPSYLDGQRTFLSRFKQTVSGYIRPKPYKAEALDFIKNIDTHWAVMINQLMAVAKQMPLPERITVVATEGADSLIAREESDSAGGTLILSEAEIHHLRKLAGVGSDT